MYAIGFDMLKSSVVEKTAAARSPKATMAAWKASLNVIGWRSPAVVDSHFDTMSRKMNLRAKGGTRVGEAAAEGQHHGLAEHQRYASAKLAALPL
jgi:hypothetical protein